MPNRTVQFRAGEYYHFYNRGVNRQPVFLCDENWGFFLRRLRHYYTPDKADIVAYCLMPNHYHLLVFLKTDKPGQQIMQPFIVSYTKAVNHQHMRSGPLFQGRFQAVHVNRDEYLRHLSRYIHLNPVLAELVNRPEDWTFSSYRDYIGLRNGTLPQPKHVLSQFPTAQAYQDFVDSYHASDRQIISAHLFGED